MSSEKTPNLIILGNHCNLWNTDDSVNAKGKILFVSPLFFWIGRITQKVHFFVMSCRNENIILRLPWLKEANPDIDWEKKSLTLDDKIDWSGELVQMHNIRNISKFNPSKHDLTGTYYKPQGREGLFNHLNYKEPKPFTVCTVKACTWETTLQALLIRWLNNLKIRKIDVATKLAREVEKLKLKPTLLPEYSNFTNIFDKLKKGVLPPLWPYGSCHKPWWGLCLQGSKSISSVPNGERSHWKVYWQKPSRRENLPLQVPPSSPILLCSKEGQIS